MDLVTSAAAAFGDTPAILSPDRTLSFTDIDEQTAALAETLKAEGCDRGQVTALVMPNSTEMVLLLLALLRTGSIAAPLNYRFPPVRLQPMLDRLSPVTVIGPRRLTAPLSGHRKTDPHQLVDNSRVHANRHPVHRMDETGIPGISSPVTIIHTSSSSGSPKAALHSLGNHYHSALGSNSNIAFTPGDCWLLSLPLFHIGGYAILIRSLAGGGAIAVPPEEWTINDAIKALRVTHLSLVPTQLYRLVGDCSCHDALKQAKSILLGGSAIEPALLRQAAQLRLPVYLSYGSTEMSSQITTTTAPTTTVTAGRILPDRELSIAENGEILVKGPCLFQGYLSESGPVPATDEHGWFHTGDTGSLSPDGELLVTGRTDNMFISGGENIHPEEIERTLCHIDGIVRCLVVPVPDTEYGQRPAAFIETGPQAPDDQSILELARRKLGRFKTPVSLTRISSWHLLPGTEKIDRGWYRREVRKEK